MVFSSLKRPLAEIKSPLAESFPYLAKLSPLLVVFFFLWQPTTSVLASESEAIHEINVLLRATLLRGNLSRFIFSVLLRLTARNNKKERFERTSGRWITFIIRNRLSLLKAKPRDCGGLRMLCSLAERKGFCLFNIHNSMVCPTLLFYMPFTNLCPNFDKANTIIGRVVFLICTILYYTLITSTKKEYVFL